MKSFYSAMKNNIHGMHSASLTVIVCLIYSLLVDVKNSGNMI